MREDFLACPHCGTRSALGTTYCPTCGEPLAPELVAELNTLYQRVRTLDDIIAAGDGAASVQTLRDDYVRRYLAQRRSAVTPQAALQTGAAAPASAPTSPTAVTPPPLAPAASAPAPAATTTAGPAAARPIFTWRAFLADQAIAIMAYLGGFLLLIATLSFEVGAWQVLGNQIKLAIVLAVYVLFGVLGFALRRSTQLRTVGRAYLGVFALLTPLVALAAYRFELQGLGFPVAGMVCVAAAYAAVIYLALAWRTGFVTYAYLGWTALVVAAMAIPQWAGAGREWEVAALASSALIMVLIVSLPRTMPALVRTPGVQVGTIASVVAALGSLILGLTLWSSHAIVPAFFAASPAAYAAAAVVVAPLAVSWSLAWRRLPVSRTMSPLVRDALDWLAAVALTQAAIGVAAWRGASNAAMAEVLTAVALAQLAAALLLRVRWMARTWLRYGVEGNALLLAAVATLLTAGAPLPDPPLTFALSAGTLIAVAVATLEAAPWLLLLAGVFASVDYFTLLAGVLPPALGSAVTPHAQLLMAFASGGFALALWAAALGLRAVPRTRRYGLPIYAVALGNALYVLLFVTLQTPGFQTTMLVVLTGAAFVAAWRERQPELGGIVTGFFGLLAVLPLTLGVRNDWTVSAVVLVASLLAIAVRVTLGRRWAFVFYVIALWATLLAGFELTIFPMSTTSVELLGLSFAAATLLAAALLATVVALLERRPEVMVVPALEGLAAVGTVQHHLAALVVVIALAGAGVALRLWRGRWWNTALYASALLASLLVVANLRAFEGNAAKWQVVELLLFAAIAYALAALERQAVFTAIAVLYTIAATWLMPSPQGYALSVALTFVAVALGVAARLRVGWPWALAWYAVAIQASLFAAMRVPHADPGQTEALLLVFAATAYAVAAIEAQPLAGLAPAAYGVWAILVQPNVRALLPLALLLAVVGFAIGRTAGPRWSWPAYLAAAAAAGATIVLGQPQPRFEALALLAIALVAYLLAAAESRPDVLPLALTLGALALAAGLGALHWAEWQGVLAFSALGWLYFGLGEVWRKLPWLHSRGLLWWGSVSFAGAVPAAWQETHEAGRRLHRWGGLALGIGASGTAMLAEDAFSRYAAPTEAVVLALLALAGLLALQSGVPGWRLALYISGVLVTLAITWQVRWLGADNVQAFILAPGGYLILAGALAPSDPRLPGREHAGQVFSFAGAALLLLPTLGQTFATDPNWLYALILALEALALVLAGVGTRSRLLVLAGSVFVGAAALRGAALAVDSGVPIPLVIGGLALLLMGGATWLSLRVRQAGQSQP
ncbi:MAG: hypothetical protein ACHQ4H_13035 [Ktedonobacterales bacterium]